MANDVSTIQSLKAVDAWIDVINANINGGVRTAFKASRLRFAGTNTQLDRAPTSTTLPLQLPEPGLITANTVIDFSQGAITSSTENTHLAIQGEGFFLVVSPNMINTAAGASFGTMLPATADMRMYLTRDGEFHTNQHGLLVNSAGHYLVTYSGVAGGGPPWHGSGAGFFDLNSGIRAVYNNVDNPTLPAAGGCVRLTDFVTNPGVGVLRDVTNNPIGATAIINLSQGMQNLRYSSFGSTIFDFGYTPNTAGGQSTINQQLALRYGTTNDATVLSKSLEASNSSMTQSVPELSLAQKLFSALTKVLQIGQTNTDSVLNLVR